MQTRRLEHAAAQLESLLSECEAKMEQRIRRMRQFLCALLGQFLAGMFFTALPTIAQQQPMSAASLRDLSNGDSASNVSPKVEIAASATSNERIFLGLPNFMTLDNSRKASPPLTAGEKFKLVARGAFDYTEFPWTATLAAMSQARDSEAGYGQGMSGYSKRFGAAFADNTIENFMVGAVFPSFLKEDPRYYRMGAGGFRRRTRYAVSHVFVTRTDSRRKRFNFSEIFGSALAAGICAYSYHPRADRTPSGAATIWGRQIGFYTLNTFLKEFWPEIHRTLARQ